MTSGGSGMQFGDDFVAARLSIDVPEGSVQAVRELTSEIERFHVTMEAAVRAEADGSRYLDQMAESYRRATEAAATYNQQMQMSLSMEARAPGSSGVPGGMAVEPFAGMSSGMGSGKGGPRPPNPSDVPYQMSQAAQTNPREHLNMQDQRGRLSSADMTSLTSETIGDLSNKIAQREQALRDQTSKTDGNTDTKVPSAGKGPGDESPSGIGERIARTAGLAGQVMNEIGPGGSMVGMGNLAMRGINAARRRSANAPGRGTPSGGESTGPDIAEEGPGTGTGESGGAAADEMGASKGLGGALGGLTKMLGPLGTALTGALATFGLVEKGGSMIQGMRNVAGVRGGAGGEGLEVETKARMLSMNPFITQDQARQVYQAVMSEGYADASGSGADNVIDFMTRNLTNMNISVADSAKMLRSTIVGNVKGDKDSVTGAVEMLGTELNNIKTLSRGGVMSTPDFTKGVMALQGSLTDMGGTPQMAAQQALLAEEAGSGDQNLKGQFAQAVGGLGSSQQGQMMLRTFGGVGVPGDLMPSMTADYLTNTGKIDEATDNTLKHFAMLAKQMDRGTPSSRENAIGVFMRYLKMIPGMGDAASSVPKARALYNKLTGSTDLLDEARQQGGSELSVPDSGGEGNPFAGVTPSQASIPTPSGGGGGVQQWGGAAAAPVMGGGGGGGAARTEVSGNVQIGLTPDAQRLLTVIGGNNAQLSPNQVGANRGVAGYSLNSPPPG